MASRINWEYGCKRTEQYESEDEVNDDNDKMGRSNPKGKKKSLSCPIQNCRALLGMVHVHQRQA